MKIKIWKGVIYVVEKGLEDMAVGALFDNSPDEIEKIIECGPEAYDAIKKFVSNVNSGSLKPRATVKDFEKILEKYAV